ncbi:MAG: hypothetical protein WCG55_02140 [bacterium]
MTRPKKIIFWVLESHTDRAKVWEVEKNLIGQIEDTGIIHEYREGRFKDKTFDSLTVRGRKIIRYAESTDRCKLIPGDDGSATEAAYAEQCTRILAWLQLDKKIAIPFFDPTAPVWYSLYCSSEANAIKGIFEQEYLPSHKPLVDSIRAFITGYVFRLDNDFYNRVKNDSNKIIIVNTGSAHRRAQWKLYEEGFDIRILQVGETPEITTSIRGMQFVSFLVMTIGQTQNMAAY